MSDGIYTALSGAIARQNQLEQVSHNLANVDTPGYRQTRQAFQEAMVDATRGVSQVRPGKVAIDLTGGRLRRITQKQLDRAKKKQVPRRPKKRRRKKRDSLSLTV